MFDLKQYRGKEVEHVRVESILDMLPEDAGEVLEAGCRYGYITLTLTERYKMITALDLHMPLIDYPRLT